MTDSTLQMFLSQRSALVQCAAAHVGSRAWAEDVVQEAYLRFAAAVRDSSLGLQRPSGYLRRIVRNLALDWAERLYPERRASSGALGPELSLSDMQAPTLPDVEVSAREELRLIADALDELPDRTRMAFALRHFDELTLDEIRTALGISTSLAHKLVENARTHCVARLSTPKHASDSHN